MRSICLTVLLLLMPILSPGDGASPASKNKQPTTGSRTIPASSTTTSRPATLDLDSYFKGFDGCFVLLDLKSGDISRNNAAQCAKRFSPCSTFKVPNAMIGLETGVISGADHRMTWDGTRHRRKECNRDQTLRSAIRDSVVWYFQRLATGVGKERMQSWIDRFEYGNRDITGGLTTFWLNDSLTISADEQVAFMAKFQRGELPISERTREIMNELLVHKKESDYVIRGKTGTKADGEDCILGWYVGTVETNSNSYAFACNIVAKTDAWGPKAREISLKILNDFVIESNVDRIKSVTPQN